LIKEELELEKSESKVNDEDIELGSVEEEENMNNEINESMDE
jgi:hypothetical protein